MSIIQTKKTRILLLTTGGTIASVKSPDGLTPGITSQQLLAYLPQIGPEISIDIKPLFDIDSTDMTAEHWLQIVRAVRENYDDVDGFVIAHGTDTMAYTAAVLSYLIQDSRKPIVLTGAQRPIGFEITDAKSNLQDSILYAADPHSRGVQIVFAGKVIAGTRARKVRSMSYAAFASINLPEIAEINNGRIIRYQTDGEFYRADGQEAGDRPERDQAPLGSSIASQATGSDPIRSRSVRFCEQVNPKVFLLKLTPGMNPALLPEIFRLYDAVVVESFGAGGIPESLRQTLFEELSKYRPEEKVLAMTTQVTYEGSHLETYEVGRRIADTFQILEASRVQRIDGRLEPHLVVALAGAAVDDGVGAFRLTDLDQLFRHQRSRHGGAQHILSFIDRIGLQRRPDIIGDELFSQIDGDGLDGAGGHGLLLDRVEIFFLSGVAADGDDVIVVFLRQPLHNDGRVQPAGISQYYFFFSHFLFSS